MEETDELEREYPKRTNKSAIVRFSDQFPQNQKQSRPKKRKPTFTIIKNKKYVVLSAPPSIVPEAEADDPFFRRMFRNHLKDGVDECVSKQKRTIVVTMDLKFDIFEKWFDKFKENIEIITKQKGPFIYSVIHKLSLADTESQTNRWRACMQQIPPCSRGILSRGRHFAKPAKVFENVLNSEQPKLFSRSSLSFELQKGQL
jgi:peroxiredoxin